MSTGKRLVVEKPSEKEIATLRRTWGSPPTSTKRLRLVELEVTRNYERCKGEGVAVIRDSRSRVVLLKRSSIEVPQNADRWVLPSGRIGIRETIEEGTVREVCEETGLDVQLTRLLRMDWVITEFQTWVNKRLHFTFLARSIEGVLKPRNQQEILEAKWFLPNQLPGPLRDSWLHDLLLETENSDRRNES